MRSDALVQTASKRSIPRRVWERASQRAYTAIDFVDVEKQARFFADEIERRREALVETLLEYESFEVAEDEITRTLDLLTNLRENRSYFRLRVNEIAAFLPRNQPLYAFTCFVAVPSLMARAVHF